MKANRTIKNRKTARSKRSKPCVVESMDVRIEFRTSTNQAARIAEAALMRHQSVSAWLRRAVEKELKRQRIS